jgi:hypothetical protein
MTTLTAEQNATLKAAIDDNPTWSAYPLTGDGYYDLAQVLSAQAAPVFWVWSTGVNVQLIRAAILWTNLTPVDTPDDTQIWANRALQCQGKQFNLQMMIPAVDLLNASDVNLRSGLQDALQGVRSGSSGVAQDAGWSAVRSVLSRKANEIEQILSDTSVGNGSTRLLSATLDYEGLCTDVIVSEARNS